MRASEESMPRARTATAIAALACAVGFAVPLAAQERRGEIAAQYVRVHSAEFDESDAGVGVRLSWRLMPLVGLDAETTFFPSSFADSPAFSSGRTEGLFGATVGPRIGRMRVFGKARTGFVRFQGAPEPFACITIFPPPLACALASGATVFALDLGGGVELDAGSRTVMRIDISDRPIRYPGPAYDRDSRRRDSSFFSHDVRFSVAGGWRF